jgi:hypothetical protein
MTTIKPGDIVHGMTFVKRMTNPYSTYLSETMQARYEFDHPEKGMGRIIVREPNSSFPDENDIPRHLVEHAAEVLIREGFGVDRLEMPIAHD